MNCPDCGTTTKVINTRQHATRRYRRHECGNGHRFTTWELFEAELLTLDGTIPRERIVEAVAAVLPELIESIVTRLATASHKGG